MSDSGKGKKWLGKKGFAGVSIVIAVASVLVLVVSPGFLPIIGRSSDLNAEGGRKLNGFEGYEQQEHQQEFFEAPSSTSSTTTNKEEEEYKKNRNGAVVGDFILQQDDDDDHIVGGRSESGDYGFEVINGEREEETSGSGIVAVAKKIANSAANHVKDAKVSTK